MATGAQQVEKQQESSVQPTRRRFTVDEYYKMAEAGILSEDDRVELIDGEVVKMAPIGIRHARCVNNLTRIFSRLADEALLQVQNPIRLNPASEVQPDVTLLRLRDYSKDQHHPGPEDVLLIVEVSDTTLLWDRREKIPLYARASIPEVWIVNLQQERIEAHSQPEGGAYKTVRRLRRGQSVAVLGFSEAKLRVEDVLA